MRKAGVDDVRSDVLGLGTMSMSFWAPGCRQVLRRAVGCRQKLLRVLDIVIVELIPVERTSRVRRRAGRQRCHRFQAHAGVAAWRSVVLLVAWDLAAVFKFLPA